MTQSDLDLGQRKITDVLGRERSVDKVYPDGSWSCPFCSSPVSAGDLCRGRAAGYAEQCVLPLIPHCQNPGCFANPHYPVARAREELAAADRRATEELQRIETREWAARHAEEGRQARAALRAAVRVQAQARGACVGCALHSLRFGSATAKFTKHRDMCPREKGRPGPWDV